MFGQHAAATITGNQAALPGFGETQLPRTLHQLLLPGFDEFELGELFAERIQGRTDPDDAPEPPAHPVAEPGDLWVLGRHRLLCGDSKRPSAGYRMAMGGSWSSAV